MFPAETLIRTAIVDGHIRQRTMIRRLLDDERDVEVVGEYRDARSAVEGLSVARADLLFLDLQMARSKPALPRLPATIVVGEHERDTLRAFESSVVDYLVKPFDSDRFRSSLQRARHHLASLRPAVLPPRFMKHLAVKTRHRIHLLRIDDIDWIEGAGNYVCLHTTGGATHHHRDTLHHFEQRLDPERFVRIHRSTIVNLDRVVLLEPAFHGEHVVILHDGTRLKLTPPYRPRMELLVGHF